MPLNTILTKNNCKKVFAPSPPRWDASCTQAVNLRKNLFKIFRQTGSPSDFYNYSNACSTTTCLLKNKKQMAWKQVCSNLKPSSSLQFFGKLLNVSRTVYNHPPVLLTMTGLTISAQKLPQVMCLLKQNLFLPLY